MKVPRIENVMIGSLATDIEIMWNFDKLVHIVGKLIKTSSNSFCLFGTQNYLKDASLVRIIEWTKPGNFIRMTIDFYGQIYGWCVSGIFPCGIDLKACLPSSFFLDGLESKAIATAFDKNECSISLDQGLFSNICRTCGGISRLFDGAIDLLHFH